MKKTLYMLLLLVGACILGGIMGNAAKKYEILPWLGKTANVDLQPGNFLKTDMLSVTFGISFSISLAQIILMLVAIFVFYKTAPLIISGK